MWSKRAVEKGVEERILDPFFMSYGRSSQAVSGSLGLASPLDSLDLALNPFV